MQLEQFTYSVEDYECVELYPFSCKNKRYFQAFRRQEDKSYRMVIYPIEMVKYEQLVEYLSKLKLILHPALGKIVQIRQKTVLVSQGNHVKKQDVIAVFIDNNQQPQPVFHHFYQSLLQYGPYNEKVARTYLSNLLDLISYMRSKGIINGFFPQDLYIERNQFELRIDNFGDRQFFKINTVTIPDSWQLGHVLFTFFNRYPPYSQPNSTDKFYLLLKNRNYDKFWEKSKRKHNTPQKVINFLNNLFNEERAWSKIEDNQWLKEVQPLTQDELAEQMITILEARIQRKTQLQIQNRAARQRYQEAIRNRHNLNRGSDTNDVMSLFIHKYNAEESQPRKANELMSEPFKGKLISTHYQDGNMIFAHILTLLESNHRQDITLCDFQDQRNVIQMRLDGMVEDELQIDVRVQLEVVEDKKKQKYIKVDCEEGSIIEQIWVHNYFKRLLSQI